MQWQNKIAYARTNCPSTLYVDHISTSVHVYISCITNCDFVAELHRKVNNSIYSYRSAVLPVHERVQVSHTCVS